MTIKLVFVMTPTNSLNSVFNLILGLSKSTCTFNAVKNRNVLICISNKINTFNAGGKK